MLASAYDLNVLVQETFFDAGVLVAGLLLGRPGREGLIPAAWIATAVGGNSVFANLFAGVSGAFSHSGGASTRHRAPAAARRISGNRDRRAAGTPPILQ